MAAEHGDPDTDLTSLRQADGDEVPTVDVESDDIAAASGITSHDFTRRGNRAVSKSTYKPPHTTDAVWTRVAFGDTWRGWAE